MVDELHDSSHEEQLPAGGPRAVAADRGWAWIAEGFGYFKRAPGPWVVIAIVGFVIAVVLSLIPLVGAMALNILMPILMGGLMLACRKQDQGGTVEIGDLFSAFSTKATPLAVVGAVYLVGMLVLGLVGALVGALIVGGAAGVGALGGQEAAFAGFGLGMLLVALIVVALSVPLMMAIWFAPALVALDGVAPVEAMKQSFSGCLRNIVPFLVYGVISFVISLVAAIPFGLGFLVWGPVLIASAYAGYRDIFKGVSAGGGEP